MLTPTWGVLSWAEQELVWKSFLWKFFPCNKLGTMLCWTHQASLPLAFHREALGKQGKVLFCKYWGDDEWAGEESDDRSMLRKRLLRPAGLWIPDVLALTVLSRKRSILYGLQNLGRELTAAKMHLIDSHWHFHHAYYCPLPKPITHKACLQVTSPGKGPTGLSLPVGSSFP